MLKSTCRVSSLRALLASVLSKVSVNDLDDEVACEVTVVPRTLLCYIPVRDTCMLRGGHIYCPMF